MAEGIMKNIVFHETSRQRIMPIEILSAGIQALDGKPASRFAIEVAAEHGINLNFHKSRLLSSDIVRNANLILTMEKYHCDYIHFKFPEANLVYELKNYPEGKLSGYELSGIPDPINQSIEVYRAIFDDLKYELNRISQLIFAHVLKKMK